MENTLYITPALPEIDFPLIMPKNVTACGPILLPEIPVSESDPELTAWLKKGNTVLVNLGSLAASDASSTRELAKGLRVVLDRRQDLQVLWKLSSERYSDDSLTQILSKEIAEGRVRIVNWLVADPLAILQSGHVVCSVHHGGANSYYEATAYVLDTLSSSNSFSPNLLLAIPYRPTSCHFYLPLGKSLSNFLPFPTFYLLSYIILSIPHYPQLTSSPSSSSQKRRPSNRSPRLARHLRLRHPRRMAWYRHLWQPQRGAASRCRRIGACINGDPMRRGRRTRAIFPRAGKSAGEDL